MASDSGRGRADGLWPRAGAALAIVALGVVSGVAVSAVVAGADGSEQPPADPAGPVARCDTAADPLDVAADASVVPIVQELADGYIRELLADGRDCVEIRVRSVASAAAVGRLTNGWRARTHGPRPEVWIPQSTVWVELLRAQLDDPTVVAPEPMVLARSPTVVAMPRPMAEAVGWPDEQLSWRRLVELADSGEGWAALEHPEWGAFRLWMTDPRYTTLGLQALLALDDAQQQLADDEGATESDAMLRLFRVQRLLSAIDPRSGEQLERYAQAAEPLRTVSALPLEERQVWAFNQQLAADAGSGSAAASERAGASAAASERDGRVPLVAIHPAGENRVAMESDYPYVVLDAPWVAQDVLQYADEFGDYLLSDAGRAVFAAAGFRGPDNEPGAVLVDAEQVPTAQLPSEPPSEHLPDIEALQRLRSTWVNVPRLSTALFVVDVSGSMVAGVPNTDLTRLEATIEAAQRTLEIIPQGGEVGLWEFSTGLEGGRSDGDFRELVTIGPLVEEVYGTTRRQRLSEALADLDPENDTALNDTVLAAYREMQAVYEPGNSHTIVLLTDGRNDDEHSIGHEELLDRLQRERVVNRPIRIVSIAYGEEADIEGLAEISETVGGEVLASPELDDLDRLFIEALSGPSLDRT